MSIRRLQEIFLEVIRLGHHKERESLDSYYPGNVGDINTDDVYQFHHCMQFVLALCF